MFSIEHFYKRSLFAHIWLFSGKKKPESKKINFLLAVRRAVASVHHLIKHSVINNFYFQICWWILSAFRNKQSLFALGPLTGLNSTEPVLVCFLAVRAKQH